MRGSREGQIPFPFFRLAAGLLQVSDVGETSVSLPSPKFQRGSVVPFADGSHGIRQRRSLTGAVKGKWGRRLPLCNLYRNGDHDEIHESDVTPNVDPCHQYQQASGLSEPGGPPAGKTQ